MRSMRRKDKMRKKRKKTLRMRTKKNQAKFKKTQTGKLKNKTMSAMPKSKLNTKKTHQCARNSKIRESSCLATRKNLSLLRNNLSSTFLST